MHSSHIHYFISVQMDKFRLERYNTQKGINEIPTQEKKTNPKDVSNCIGFGASMFNVAYEF